jgi:hypothetical protein
MGGVKIVRGDKSVTQINTRKRSKDSNKRDLLIPKQINILSRDIYRSTNKIDLVLY